MTGASAHEFAMPSTQTSTTQQVFQLLRQRQNLAQLRSSAAGINLEPRTAGFVRGAETLSGVYLTLAKNVMQATLRSTSNRAELAIANYGLGLIALSQRNPEDLFKIGRDLVQLDLVGRHYMNLLLAEPDMYPRIRGRWTALLQDRQAGLGA